MISKVHIFGLLTGCIVLAGCASSSSGGKVSIGGKQRTIDFCSRPSDIGTALACEAGKLGAELVIDAAADAYKSARKNNAPEKPNSEKNLLDDLSDKDICEGAYGRENGLASHQYVAGHRNLDCLESYTDDNLCKAILKNQKLMQISPYHTNSISFKEGLSKMESEKKARTLNC